MSKTIAIYCRVSTDDQDCTRQVRDLKRLAKRLEYDIYDVFIEHESGAKANREVRDKVIKLAKTRKIDGILVSELSRWSRSLPDLIHTLDELSQREVMIMTLHDTIDFKSASGRLMANILGIFAQFERELIVERTKSGLANARAKGKVLGRPKYHERFKEDNLDNVLELHSQGLSLRAIAKELGISKSSVSNLIKEGE